MLRRPTRGGAGSLSAKVDFVFFRSSHFVYVKTAAVAAAAIVAAAVAAIVAAAVFFDEKKKQH